MSPLKDKIKLVIADIDGTLVDPDKQFSANTRKVIRFLHEQGILFGVASGRPIDEVDRFDAAWELGFTFDIIIGFNGGALRDNINHTEEQHHPMKKEWIKEVVENVMTRYGYSPWVYKDGGMLVLEDDWGVRRTQSHNGKPLIFASSPQDLYAEDNPKVLVHIPPEDMARVEADVATWIPSYYKAFKTQEVLLEFANTKVSKGAALEAFCRDHSIDLKEVVSFGDASNDNEMLEVSGLGVCLKNGLPDTKAVADEITPYSNSEDGFARYVTDILLPRYGYKLEL